MKNTSSIVTILYPIIDTRMKTKTQGFRNVVGRYISNHSKELYDIGPFDRIYFGVKEWEDFYKTMGQDLKEVSTTAINGTYYYEIAKFNPKAAKDEFTIILMMILRYFSIKKESKDLELAAIYLAFSGSFYPSVHYGSFPVVQPSEYRHIMEYVINHELTQKYDIITEGSIFGSIKSICNTWLIKYKNDLKTSDDDDIVYMIQQLRDRIKSFMINIAEVYYDVYDNKSLYMSYDSDSAEQDSFRIADNDSLKAEKFSESAMIYVTSNDVNFRLCNNSSDVNVKTDEVKFIIESIQRNSKNVPLIKELIRLIIIQYFELSSTKDVRSMEFVSKSISAKPNSKNKNFYRQKEIIYGWLEEISDNYRRRKHREPTKNSYYNCILKYYVLIINLACK